jgi:opacity protein-like surface antigen
MRVPTLFFALALAAPAALSGQTGMWTGTLAAGYAHGVGDAFGGKGAISAQVAAFRTLGSGAGLGLELGYSRFNSLTTSIPDLYGPGSLQREDFRRSLWVATASVRLHGGGTAWRPFAGAGIGTYLARVHDQILTQDTNGTPIPGLQFDDSSSEVKLGMNLLAGVERPRVFGRAGLGLQARWDAVLSGALANVLSLGIVLTLD